MNWKRFMVVAFALLVALSIGSGRLAAQTSTTGDVTGIVTDPSNAVVPDAKVILKSDTKGNAQESKSSKDGVYRFYLLSPGPYTVEVTAAGFDTVSRHVDVAVGQVATINVTLAVGTSSTTVTVTEAAPLLQTDNGDTGRFCGCGGSGRICINSCRAMIGLIGEPPRRISRMASTQCSIRSSFSR